MSIFLIISALQFLRISKVYAFFLLISWNLSIFCGKNLRWRVSEYVLTPYAIFSLWPDAIVICDRQFLLHNHLRIVEAFLSRCHRDVGIELPHPLRITTNFCARKTKKSRFDVRFIVEGCGDIAVKFETANENDDGIQSKWENRIGGQNVFWHSNSDSGVNLIKNETDAIAI